MSGRREVRTVIGMSRSPRHPSRQDSKLGLPIWALASLSLLGLPRVVLHDLDLVPSQAAAGLLAIVPALIWIGTVVWAQARAPLAALLVVGIGYGVILAICHNLFFDRVFAADPPALAGNLQGRFPAGVEEAMLRVAMSISSVFTGAAVGLICGLIAMGILALRQRVSRTQAS
jgi:sulfite exporter TauE/SafE